MKTPNKPLLFVSDNNKLAILENYSHEEENIDNMFSDLIWLNKNKFKFWFTIGSYAVFKRLKL